MSIDPLIDRVRELDPSRHVAPDPAVMEQLLAELRSGAGAERRVSVRRRPRLSMGGVVACVALASTVAVVLVALSSLRGGQPPIPEAASRLASELSILRRPQTVADTKLDYALYQPGEDPSLPPGQLVGSLTRLAVRVPGLNVYVVVQRPTPWPNGEGMLWKAALGDQAGLMLAPTRGPNSGYQTVPAVDLYRHIRVWDAAGGLPVYAAELVPDGVARVTWVIGRRSANGTSADLTLVAPTIRNNVAFAALPNGLVPGGVGSSETPAERGITTWHDTWYSRNGKVIPQPTAPERAAAAATPRFYRPTAAAVGDFPVLGNSRPVREPGITISPTAGLAYSNLSAQFRGARTQLVRTVGGKQFYVIPTRLGACIAEGRGLGAGNGDFGYLDNTVTCSESVAGLLRQGVWKVSRYGIGYGQGWRNVMFGVVPDNNPSITLKLQNGETRTVRVVDGVFGADVYHDPVAIELRSANGTLRTWPVASP